MEQGQEFVKLLQNPGLAYIFMVHEDACIFIRPCFLIYFVLKQYRSQEQELLSPCFTEVQSMIYLLYDYSMSTYIFVIHGQLIRLCILKY